MLGLPDGTHACLFDLDGVLTKTVVVHNAAWKEMFDAYLQERSRRTGEPFVPFDPGRDYDEYVDGKPRADGTRSFLASRGIELPEGSDDDPPGAETIHGLGTRKNEIVLRREPSGWDHRRPRSSRTRWPAWKRAGRAGSVLSSGLIAPGRRMP